MADSDANWLGLDTVSSSGSVQSSGKKHGRHGMELLAAASVIRRQFG